MSNTAILKCGNAGCRSEYQDERYGKGMRVHNEGRKDSKASSLGLYSCTVCGSRRNK